MFLKKLHLLILRSFIGPFAAGFSVTLFILVLQFLAKYQDDIFGKGFGTWVIMQLFCYASASLCLLALPLAILLASLMTLGKLGENYELAAIKSAGISLFRVINPLALVTILLMGVAFALSFYLIPIANLKLYSLLYDVQQTKPELVLKPGLFYHGIDGYTLRISGKNPETNTLYDVQIYDHTQNRGVVQRILADSGSMIVSPDKRSMMMTLFHGSQHNEPVPEPGKTQKWTYTRFYFDTLRYRFDLTGFSLNKTDEQLFASHQYMLNIQEIGTALDSMKKFRKTIAEETRLFLHPQFMFETRLQKHNSVDTTTFSNSLSLFPQHQRKEICQRTLNSIRGSLNYLEVARLRNSELQRSEAKYSIEYHLKFCLPIACIIFLYIGAPLGAIIRKGGLGMPVIISIGFFILFYVLMTQGKKLAREDVLPTWLGVWIPILVTAPIAVYLSRQSTTDSRLFDLHSWKKMFNFHSFFKKAAILLLFSFMGGKVVAQQTLTARQAVDAALKNHYQIQVARSQADIAHINNHPSIAGALPVVTLTLNDNPQLSNLYQKLSNGTIIEKNYASSNSLNSQLAGTWTLFNGWKIQATQKRLAVLDSQARYNLDLTILETASATLLKYYDVLRQQAYLKTSQKLIETAQNKLQIIQQRIDMGRSTQDEFQQAEFDKNVAVQNFESQKLMLKYAEFDLLEQIQVSSDSSYRFPENFDIDTTLQYSKLYSNLSKHPYLLSALADVEVGVWLSKEAQSLRFPTLRLSAGYNYSLSQAAAGFSLLNQNYGPSAGISLSVPIFSGGAAKRTIESSNIQQQIQYQKLQGAKQNQQIKFKKDWEAYQTAIQQLRNERQNILLAESLSNSALNKLKNGHISLWEATQAIENYERSLNRLINQQFAAKIAEIQLLATSATLSW